MVGRSAGVVIMAPPDDSAEAQKALATLLSSLKPKQKVCAFAHIHNMRSGGGCGVLVQLVLGIDSLGARGTLCYHETLLVL